MEDWNKNACQKYEGDIMIFKENFKKKISFDNNRIKDYCQLLFTTYYLFLLFVDL